MTKSIQQIKQELDSTKSAVADTAVELQNLYGNYLDLLSQSVKQQLILASYQICTQFYPQSFLNLSLSNKQDLQQSLRHFGTNIQPKLQNIIEEQELEPEPNELNLMAELIKNLPKTKIKHSLEKDKLSREDAEEIDLESVKAELANIEFIEIDASEDQEEDDENDDEADNEIELDDRNAEERIDNIASQPAKEKLELNNPQHLLLWHKQIERKIKSNLDYTSKKVNKCLQDYKVIPDRIPSKIIDVAVQTEGGKGGRNNRKLPNAPNILHLAIETDSSKKSKIPQNLVQISLLRLRLAEIEFSDPMLNAKRGQIRNLIAKINKLNNQHRAIQEALAVAEAQAAWRSSWYED